MSIRVLDLFSGIGGMTLGLEAAGPFRAVGFCESDRFCQRVLGKHWPGVPIYPDARTMRHDGDVDIITSGDPCQQDSIANAGRDGDSMWPHALRQIERHRPVYVLRENVLGNVTTGTAERVERDLVSNGYRVRTYVIPADAVGAAHQRLRTWTLAYSDRAGSQECNDAAQPSRPKGWQHSCHLGPTGLRWLATESPVLRTVDDVPNGLDRIKALGNSVVPEIPYRFGLAIMAQRKAASSR